MNKTVEPSILSLAASKRGKARLVLVRGWPGSGKSTLAAKIAAEEGCEHLEADTFFLKDGQYQFKPARLPQAHEWCLNQAREALEAGRRVIVANVFETAESLRPYLALGYPWEIIDAAGNWKNVHGVPQKTVAAIRKQWLPKDQLTLQDTPPKPKAVKQTPVAHEFTARPIYEVELPLKKHVRILHPEQVVLRIGPDYWDVGALCYALRSEKKRKPGQAAEVVLSSLIKERPKQIRQVIKVLSAMLPGKSVATVRIQANCLKLALDWADANGHPDCLAGGDATRRAFHAYAADVDERFKRQVFGSANASKLQTHVCELFEAITGTVDLKRGVRFIKVTDWANGGTEPVSDHDFGHMAALSQSLFDGLCDLVLNEKPFPYQLALPKSLGWAQSHLWLFPTKLWRLPPHQWDPAVRQTLGGNASWPYDYEHGRLATVDAIWHRYLQPTESMQRHLAKRKIETAQRQLDDANADPRHHWRLELAMLAHNAFCWLLHAKSGANQQPILDLETDGTVDVAVAQQGFRNVKWRAGGKEVPICLPASFIKDLKKYMELRAWLLKYTTSPYLFFTWGTNRAKPTPERASDKLLMSYCTTLRRIDPTLKPILARKTRATVDDVLLRKNDAAIVARIIGHTEKTEQAKYGRGSTVDHRDDLTVFYQKLSAAAKKQTVIPIRADLGGKAKPLEQGGGCAHYGHPEAMTDDPALQPDCAGGCWFCTHRMLVADELDARKVTSAAFVMEQLILGPQHEAKLRPLITKCESDLECIAQSSDDCPAMVARVKQEVFEEGHLTPYWTEKYHLFLELEVIA